MRKIIFFPQLNYKICCERGIFIDTSVIIIFALIEVLSNTANVGKVEGSCKA